MTSLAEMVDMLIKENRQLKRALARAEKAQESGNLGQATEDGALRLKSFVYADRLAEFRQLEEAIEVCRRVPAEIDQADGGDWLPEQLAPRRPGVATVVYHSLLIDYPTEDSLARMGEAIQRAAAAATSDAPVAWLRFEAPAGATHEKGLPTFEVRLALWPGGDDRLVATAHLWGKQVRWLA